MRRGELVPDSTVWEMVRERTGCLRCLGGFILDGFPRTLGQAESLNGLIERENLSLNAVVDYEMPLEEVVSRLSGRRTCKECKSVFHVTQQPPKVDRGLRSLRRCPISERRRSCRSSDRTDADLPAQHRAISSTITKSVACFCPSPRLERRKRFANARSAALKVGPLH